MDFNDSPEEAAYRAKVRSWLDANATLRDPDKTRNNMLDEAEGELIAKAKAWQAKKTEEGWACLRWPKEYGGQGASAMESVIFNQEEARYDLPPSIYGIGHGMLGPTIMAHGTDEQKKRFLPDMVKGNEVWCQLFSEPDAGSDLAGLKMSAVKDGDDWVINGQKIWTTGAQFCKWGMLVARTDTNVAKHAGLTYFIVDMEAPGIEIRPIKQMNGGSGFNEVFFGDVRTPDNNRLGGVGDGWRVAITTLMNERSSIGSSLGGGGTINDLIRLAQKVELDGRSAIEDGGVRRAIADFAVKRSGLKYTGQRGLSALSQGQTPGPEASIGKLIAAVMGQEMGAFGMELQGSAGVLSGKDSLLDPVWQNTYLAMPGLRLAGGTDEILRNIIAERVLGMPGEPRMDKGKAFKDIPTGR
ncbi:MAG: acyl-CoA dehydrogenase family protein [Deltaproteobacteria bacterium]|nr:acyl-CoA dehydrogenase family protein [Deltaproteobacteria bacterium]MBW2387681.1 acyl-CoA dehydrogenase family protein [Deltaproteobacteria bacterium]MBW2724565.1 acyl-CoA dehydrogenase family protein [Deltaproteobacteria bacterium]